MKLSSVLKSALLHPPRLNTIRISVAITFFVFSGLISVEQAKAIALTIDDMLEYTIADLNQRMQEVINDNKQMTSRNDALRKRMLFLREQSRQLEDQKLQLMEEYLKLTADSRLDAKDYFLSEKKDQVAQDHFARLKTQKERLTQIVDKDLALQKDIEEQVQQLQKDISDIQQKRKNIPTAKPPVVRQQQFAEYRKLIQQVQSGIKQKQGEADSLSQRIASLERERAQLIQIQEQHSSRIDTLEKEGTLEEQKNRLLQEEIRGLEDRKVWSRQQIDDRLSQLKRDRDQIRNTLDQTQKALENVASEIEQKDQKLTQFSRSLDQERKILTQYSQVLTQQLALRAELKRAIQQNKTKDSLPQDSKNKKTIGNEERKTLMQDLSQQQTREKALQKDIARLQAEIQAKQKQLAGVSQQTLLRQKQASDSRKKELLNSISQRQDSIRNLKRAMQNMQQRLGEAEGQLTREKGALAELSERKETLLKDVEDLTGEMPTKIKSEGVVNKKVSDIKQDIEILQTQSNVLSSSLPVIKSRLDSEDLEVKEFRQDERQLKEYLSVLSQENMTLKDKVLSLTDTLEQLTTADPDGKKGRARINE
jgi:chromosome segregation ATPase